MAPVPGRTLRCPANLTGDDRATILGALLWMADKLKGSQGERARALWEAKGKQGFEVGPTTNNQTNRTDAELSGAREVEAIRAWLRCDVDGSIREAAQQFVGTSQ
jgi:Conjugal transfer protein TraD